MKTTQEQRKQKAVELMQKLDIYKPYIDGFVDENKVCLYEGYGGFWTEQETELQEKIDQIEKIHNCTVYAVTHEFTEFGELYSMLLVPLYKEDWRYLVTNEGKNKFFAFAYVWNKEADFCSEFGSIVVHSFGGGIRRIG